MFQHILLGMCGTSPISPGRLVLTVYNHQIVEGPYHDASTLRLHFGLNCLAATPCTQHTKLAHMTPEAGRTHQVSFIYPIRMEAKTAMD